MKTISDMKSVSVMKTIVRKVLIFLSILLIAGALISPAHVYAGTNSGNGHFRNSTACSCSYRSSSKKCMKTGCDEPRTAKGLYCSAHTCIKSGCYRLKKSGSSYCSLHDSSASSYSRKNSSSSRNSSSSKSSSSSKRSSASKRSSSSNGYDDGYEAIWLDEDYDEECYDSDPDYADGVDDAMDEYDW